jgi:hypothetical protein
LKINTTDWYYLNQFDIIWVEYGAEWIKSEEYHRDITYLKSYLTEWRREILENLSKHKKVFHLEDKLEEWDGVSIVLSEKSVEDVEKMGLVIVNVRAWALKKIKEAEELEELEKLRELEKTKRPRGNRRKPKKTKRNRKRNSERN